ncbi:peptidase S8/S53 domain-containing protein [Scheffersomyces xylosifermentans]|uniref:peptidase S8/S53 domain-containing protein n=1 Tax=Scheffersomyces xylosifermentans TaxID=1304137 RepID=UPI00315C81B4
MQPKSLFASLAVYLTVANALVIPSVSSFFDFDKLLPKVGGQQPGQQPLNLHDHQPLVKDYLAPLIPVTAGSIIIPNRYIVVYKDDVSEAQRDNHRGWLMARHTEMVSTAGIRKSSAVLDFFGVDTINGYLGYFTEDVIKEIQNDPRIKFIEHDSLMSVNEFDVQKDAEWGLNRISHRENSPKLEYLYDNQGGKGVTAYVIDTGIKTDHEEFEGRASWGQAVAFPNLKLDGHGHGTHCAGIIGSKTYGVAKQVELVAVGVMNLLGSGTTSDIIKGVEFVVNEHKTKLQSKQKGFKGSTVNMSIGGGESPALDLAVNAATKAGLHVAVAAGNSNEDTCNSSPARATGPITVGASDVNDNKADFSNWGKCVDIFAPGVDIVSTYIWSETTSMSGTSMASPHIAGLLSYYLSLYPEPESEYSVAPLDAQTLKSKVIKYATKGVIKGLNNDGSPNLLAYNGAGANLTDFWSL